VRVGSGRVSRIRRSRADARRSHGGADRARSRARARRGRGARAGRSSRSPARLRTPAAAVRGLRVRCEKQATRPAPAVSIGLAGTAPGLVFRAPTGCVVVVLPGPPGELRRLWPNALASEPMRELLERTRPPGRRVLRLFGVSESAVARAFEEAGGDGDGSRGRPSGAREFEIHVGPRRRARRGGARGRPRGGACGAPRAVAVRARRATGGGARARSLRRERLAARDRRVVHGRHGRGAAHGRAGSSASFVGGVVAYADEVKRSEAGCARGADRAARRVSARSRRDGRGRATAARRRRGRVGDGSSWA
jgi:nicotinamide-nucleotide amidase